MKKITDILFSYWMMLTLLFILGVGAAIGTFIENDYGTSTARVLVYNSLWHEIVLTLSIINMLGIIYRRKMWKGSLPKFIFHMSFAIMLIGAAMTRYIGYEGIMHIREGQTQNEMISLEPYLQIHIDYKGKSYYQEYQYDMSAIDIGNDFHYKVKFADKVLNVDYVKYLFAKKGQSKMGITNIMLSLDDQKQEVRLVGMRAMPGAPRVVDFKDVHIEIVYGSKPLSLPFAIRLNDFQLDRYPGSMSPSSYASEVTVIDEKNNVEFDYRIFMNSTLHYGGFMFFQSSYDQDEKGTILSVNNDPGKWPTYLAYFLLALGLIMNMFDKKSRFSKLTKYIGKYSASVIFALLVMGLQTQTFAASTDAVNNLDTTGVNTKLDKYLDEYRKNSKQTAAKFGQLVTQAGMGRMKPVDSLDLEIVQKLTRKSSFLDMDANQIVLGMLSRPDMWRYVKMIKIRTPKLKKTLGLPLNTNYVSFDQLFHNDTYVLRDLVQKANATKPLERGTYEKDIIKLDERLNIAYMVYYGNLFKIYPKLNDKDSNHKWYNPLDAMKEFTGKNQKAVEAMTRGFIDAMTNADYAQANKFLDFMIQYQKKVGADIIPSQNIIDNEILFNKIQLFPKLTIAYILMGLLLFIVSFLTVFNRKFYSKKFNTFMFVIVAILFAIHTAGMGMRWYISGHAPWSNTYESLLYISWSAMFAGTVFFRKSLMALAGTVVMAGIFMFTAHLSGIDPQITNLVPVLKSYWLTIHVSVITASYGFLGLGAILGLMALLMFNIRDPKKPHIDETINHITAINEAALIIGLAMLTVGNFLGGVWANESWGRYWGWDPKETWAWVSIIVYAFVLHARLIKKLNNPYVFNTLSLFAFSSILMTYFGVNFYLSGMHSYATGDPVPIPTWVYYMTAGMITVTLLAYRKRDLPKLKV